MSVAEAPVNKDVSAAEIVAAIKPGVVILTTYDSMAKNSINRNVKGVSYFCAATSYQVAGSEDDLSAAMKLLERVIRDHPDAIYQCRHPSHPQHRVIDDSRASLHRMKNRVVGR